MSVAAYLKKLREARGLSLRDVERLSDVSSGHLSMIEQEKVRHPSPRILHSLAGLYGVDYIGLMKKAGYLPSSLSETKPARSMAFKGAERLSPEQRKRVQRLIEFELFDAERRKRKE
jgi:transcriptional regulator with XRE-family HTH domain